MNFKMTTSKAGIEKVNGLVRIKAEYAHFYTKTQNDFAFEAYKRADGSFAIYPSITKTGKSVTGSQSARHSTVAKAEYLELV